MEAYFRHKASPVGLALRGEPFCVNAGLDGLLRPSLCADEGGPALCFFYYNISIINYNL